MKVTGIQKYNIQSIRRKTNIDDIVKTKLISMDVTDNFVTFNFSFRSLLPMLGQIEIGKACLSPHLLFWLFLGLLF